jgi:hypothetical protein
MSSYFIDKVVNSISVGTLNSGTLYSDSLLSLPGGPILHISGKIFSGTQLGQCRTKTNILEISLVSIITVDVVNAICH